MDFKADTPEAVNVIISVVITLFLLIVALLPISLAITNKSFRLWFKSGIEGENNKLDPSEIHLMIRFYIIITCIPILIVMIMTSGLGYDYPIIGWVIICILLVGAEAKEVIEIVKGFIKR